MHTKHGKKTNNRKVPIIIAVIAAVVVLAAIICIIVFLFSKDKSENNAATTPVSTVQITEQPATTETSFVSEVETEAADNNVSEPSNSEQTAIGQQQIALPIQSGAKLSYFSADYSPYKAVDTETGDEVSMRLVFGSAYSGGTVSFKNDGSFSDNLINSYANTGSYAVDVEKKTITATYTNDKNMDITVLSWNSDTPAEIIINYGGFDIYLK